MKRRDALGYPERRMDAHWRQSGAACGRRIRLFSLRIYHYINIYFTVTPGWPRERAAVMVKEQFRETDVAKKM